MKFKYRLYMQVTEKQFRSDLECQLKQLGYKDDIQRLFQDEEEILLTSVKTSVFRTTTINHWDNTPKYFIKIEEYNPELFLAIAAMTEGEDWIVGEYLITKIYRDDKNCIFKCKELEGADYSIGRAGLTYKHFYRKPTLEELYEHFNYSKPKETKMEYKFEEGDVVEIIKYGYGCNHESVGQKAAILEKGKYNNEPGYIISDVHRGSHNSMKASGSYGSFVAEKSLKKVDLLPDKKLDKSWTEIAEREFQKSCRTLMFGNPSDNHFKKMWEDTVPKKSFNYTEYPVTPDEAYPKTLTKIERPKKILIKLRKSKKNKLKF